MFVYHVILILGAGMYKDLEKVEIFYLRMIFAWLKHICQKKVENSSIKHFMWDFLGLEYRYYSSTSIYIYENTHNKQVLGF